MLRRFAHTPQALVIRAALLLALQVSSEAGAWAQGIDSIQSQFAAEVATLSSPSAGYEERRRATERIVASRNPQAETFWVSLLESGASGASNAMDELSSIARSRELSPQTQDRLFRLVENSRDRPSEARFARFVLVSATERGSMSAVRRVSEAVRRGSGSVEARGNFAEILGAARSESTISDIAILAEDTSEDVKYRAVGALERYAAQSREARAAIRRSLKAAPVTDSLKRRALSIFSQMASVVPSAPSDWMHDSDRVENFELLTTSLQDPDRGVREIALEALIDQVHAMGSKGVIGQEARGDLAQCLLPGSSFPLPEEGASEINGSRYILDIFLFGGIPVLSTADPNGAKAPSVDRHDLIRKSVKDAWSPSDVAELRKMLLASLAPVAPH